MKFFFVVKATVSFGVEVEADTIDDAIAMAKDADTMTLCHHCTSQRKGTWATELDCNAQEGVLVDVHTDCPVNFDDVVEKWGCTDG